MSPEPLYPPPNDAGPSRRASPQPESATTSTSNVPVSTVQEDKEYLSSLSQKSSPRLTSILLSPPEKSGMSRPRSSEGRVTSLNLPKHTLKLNRPSTSQVTSLGPASRRRSVSHTSLNKSDPESKRNESAESQAAEGLFNFGMGDEYALEPKDPHVLEDVQKALKSKALREARAKSAASTAITGVTLSTEGNPSVGPSRKAIASVVPVVVAPVTPPRPTVFISTRTSSPAALPRITFPSHVYSPSRSLESVSSTGRIPVPTLMTSQDGSAWLDWSGAPPENDAPEKDRSLLGRTFSITKRKSKAKDRLRGLTGRNSLDFGASQGDLHTARLDSIRRTAGHETLSRADVAKDELGWRYASLARHKSTDEHPLHLLDIVKSRPDNTNVSAPWLAWTRPGLNHPKANPWTVTATFMDEYLRASGRPSTRPSLVFPSAPMKPSGGPPHSPTYGFSSPFASPRSSLNISPTNNDPVRKDGRRMELSRSLSANPVIEGVSSPSASFSPTLSRSLSLTRATTSGNLGPPPNTRRASIDMVMGSGPAAASFTNLNDSPRSSLDRGSRPQPISNPNKSEKQSLRKKFRTSLSGDKLGRTLDSRTSTMSSLTNLFGTAHTHGSPPSNGRRHLVVGNMFGRRWRNGEESGEATNVQCRSSVSDERDSGRDGEGTKSDDPAGLRSSKSVHISRLDIRGMRSRRKDTLNTSDSEIGGGSTGEPFGSKLGRRFRGPERDQDRDRSAEDTTGEVARDSVSGGERREIDALATPGWTSRRGIRRARMSAPKGMDREKLQERLRKQEEEEERLRDVYKVREVMLVQANDHNRRMARLLKAVGASIREYEEVQSELAQVVGSHYNSMTHEVLDAISADPATTLRHGKGWRAVEDSHRRFSNQQALLASYLSTLTAPPEREDSSDLADAIQESEALWRDLRIKSQQIEKQEATTKPLLKTAVAHMHSLQKEYNVTQILVETDYPEQTRIADLEMIITESRAPRGWLEFAAFWIPEHVLEFIGGFIRFFGVPISEKFVRPLLWYFFRNRYYWKIYSTEPPPNERAWYTRLGYWVILLSILAWYTTA